MGKIDNKAMYDKIEARVKELGFANITDFCRKNRLPRAFLSDFRCGRTKKLSSDKIADLCNALNVSADFFYGLEHNDAITIKSESYVEIEKKPSAGDSDEWLSFLYDIVRGFDEDQINDLRTYAEFLAHKRESK